MSPRPTFDLREFVPLNLPTYDIALRRRKVDGAIEVYDDLRRIWVMLTPEEWVRQHFVHYLVAHLGYPALRMANAVGLHFNGTQRRCDTVIYDESLTPVAIVEYKSPSVTVNQHVFDQIVRYNLVLKTPYLFVSNGVRHYCVSVDASSGTYRFLADLPLYSDIVRGK